MTSEEVRQRYKIVCPRLPGEWSVDLYQFKRKTVGHKIFRTDRWRKEFSGCSHFPPIRHESVLPIYKCRKNTRIRKPMPVRPAFLLTIHYLHFVRQSLCNLTSEDKVTSTLYNEIKFKKNRERRYACMGEQGKNKIAGSKSMSVNSSTKILTLDFQESVVSWFLFLSPTKARFHDLAKPRTERRTPPPPPPPPPPPSPPPPLPFSPLFFSI